MVRTRDVVAERGAGLAEPTNRQPAERIRGASASAASPASCRCSGASSSTNARASSMPSSTECWASSASRIAWSSLTATVNDPSPCSAWPARSAFSASRSAPRVATTVRSDGPANPSMPTTPDTCRLASCTHSDPGPTITSTLGIDSVPYAKRGDGLGAGDGEVGVRAAQLRRGDHHRMRRADHVHLVHARGARRHDAHHDRRRIRVAAAGRVDRGAPHGHVTQLHGVPLRERHEAIVVEPRLRHRADVVDRDLEPGAHGVVEHAGLRREGRTRARAEADLELLERRVTTGAHPGDDPRDILSHRRARRHRRADLVSPSHAASPGPRRSPPPSRGRRPGWRSAAPWRPRSSRGPRGRSRAGSCRSP